MELDTASQSRLIAALKRMIFGASATRDSCHLHTHISHVLLVGDCAYKIKKPVDMGFLNFSTLARRKYFCKEEIRLNRRLAPDIYRDVVSITGPAEFPHIDGDGEVLEYAVRMRRFSQSSLLSGRTIGAGLIERIAERMAAFHAGVERATLGGPFGTPESVLTPMRNNFAAIRGTRAITETPLLIQIQDWTEATCVRLRSKLWQRRVQGGIRECHGDLHLGNIALDGDELIIFDGIEFDPFLRWIDTINDCAFLLMDLEHRSEQALASQFLNRYLEIGGDYAALTVLDFYRVYRAMVRAKVECIRLGQADLDNKDRAGVMEDLGRHLVMAQAATQPGRAALVITHGVSGSGKSHAGASLVSELGAVRVRSDIERKRLFGLAEHEASHAVAGGIYTAEVSARTYAQLCQAARVILESGRVAVVDAAFLLRAQRDDFRALAVEMGCPYLVLMPQASPDLLTRRLDERTAAGVDASEADTAVLMRQTRKMEPLSRDELVQSLAFDSTLTLPLEQIRTQLRMR